MTDAAHAVLSPSSAHRFFPCPGSVRLSAGIPRASSPYASEGTAAHTLAAICLEAGTDASARIGDVIIADGVEFTIDEGMAEAVQVHLDTVWRYAEHGFDLSVEEKLDLGHLWPGTFGTGDVVGYHAKRKLLVVIDYKHGAGVPVGVIDNPQLLSYLSGAWRRYREIGPIEALTGVIVQPRAGGAPVKEWQVSLARLEDFESEFRRAAELAMLPDAELHAGAWCRFCPAAAVCPELRRHMHQTALVEFDLDQQPVAVEPIKQLPDPAALNAAQLGNILANADLFEQFIEAVKREGLRRARNGELPTGWKVVEKRTHRRWKDEDKALRALVRLYELSEDDVVKRKLISPAQAEAKLGKSLKNAIAGMIVKPRGDPVLAPEADPRPSIPVDMGKEFGQDLLIEQMKATVNDDQDRT